MRRFLFVLFMLFPIPAFGYTTPAGIPNPSTFWGALDPIEEAVPAHVTACPNWPSSESPDCYYIDVTAGNATDTNNDYGYPDKPRATLPSHNNSDPFPAGTYIEVGGGVYNPFDNHKYKVSFAGTEASPCWFVWKNNSGVEGTYDGLEWMISGSYLLLDGVHIGNGNSAKIFLDIGDNDALVGTANHISIRNIVSVGDGVAHSNGSAISITGLSDSDETEYVVIYNVVINNWGSDTGPEENDFHGILPSEWSEHVWVLDSHINNMGGDAMQIGSNNYDGDKRPQYIYVGNCIFHDDYENAVDVKQAMDVIVSHNEFYGYEMANASDGAAMVVHRQNESGQLDGPERIWFLFNKIHDSVRGIRFQDATEVWAIGNDIYNITCQGDCDHQSPAWDDGYAIHIRTNSSSGGAVNNTIYDCFGGIQSPNAPPEGWTISGNIFYNRTNAETYDIYMDTTDASAGNIDYNDMYSNIRVHINGTDYTDISSLTSSGKCTHCLAVDPLFLSTSNHNLQGGSLLKDAGVEDDIYAEFEAIYGLNIKVDLDRVPRPQGSAYDIGAYEYTDGSGPTCSDGIQNGDETGTDCGGSCQPCTITQITGTSPMIH